MLRISMAFVLLGMVAAAATQDQTASHDVIRVEIGGLRSNAGQVLCALYSSAEDFPKKPEKAQARMKAEILEGRAVCVFSGVAPGTYAVSVMHDENSNGKLDANFIGIPREGVGSSNDAKGHFGPPKFGAASFRYSGGRLEMKITMMYL